MLTSRLKNFLKKQHILELIDNNAWEEFYDKLYAYDPENVGEVTNFLINTVGIDPLIYMSTVPKYFRSEDHTITTLTIPNNINKIETCAFELCESLTSVTIPASVELIGQWAFKGCTNIKSIIIEGSNTHAEPFAFFGVHNATVTINKDNEDMIYYFENTGDNDVRVVSRWSK